MKKLSSQMNESLNRKNIAKKAIEITLKRFPKTMKKLETS